MECSDTTALSSYVLVNDTLLVNESSPTEENGALYQSSAGNTPKCQARDKKKFVLGLTYFYAHLPACSNSDTKITCVSRIKTVEARNLPLNFDTVIGINQHLVDQ